ncbi:MAG: hypothetical protein HQ559_01595 [Lentisphaerae bacterium]|nr:hypothetical protein [Lentisphaerota bacterium]
MTGEKRAKLLSLTQDLLTLRKHTTLTPRQLATGLQAAERAYGFYHTFAGAEKSLLWAAKTGLRAAHRA